MSHLADDELPSEFDVVVQGTGVVESMLAAAFSRVGKSVLHLDRNGYYGLTWASLMQREILDWLEELNSSESSIPSSDITEETMNVITLASPPNHFYNIVQIPPLTKDCVTDIVPGSNNQGGDVVTPSNGDQGGDVVAPSSGDQGGDVVAPSSDGKGGDVVAPSSDGKGGDVVTPSSDGKSGDVVAPSSDGKGGDVVTPSSDGKGGDVVAPSSDDQGIDIVAPSNEVQDIDLVVSNEDHGSDSVSPGDGNSVPPDGDGIDSGLPEGHGTNSGLPEVDGTDSVCTDSMPPKDHWNNSVPPTGHGTDLKSLGSKVRRLVYDLFPKVLACRGSMVELLTQSGCSRYLEFKAINKICIYQSGQVEQVPCSRADVFESKLVSMVEKRRMMKFLSFCAEYKEDSSDDTNVSFGEYMKRHGLTENLACYVALSIAMMKQDVPAKEGLLAAKLFLQSLGRFDNAPFLYPIYGCGELPQAFCRFCAVYGGVYCLKRHVTAIHTSEAAAEEDNTHLLSVTCSSGQKIACSTLICPVSDVRTTFNIEPKLRLSRGIIVTDGPIKNMHDQLVLLTIPAGTTGPCQVNDVRLIQLPASTSTAVDGTYMFHLMCINQESCTAEEELQKISELFFTPTQQTSNYEENKPLVLWTLYFNMNLSQIDEDHYPQVPANVYLTSDPDESMTYEKSVLEAKKIFHKVCPNEDFLPTSESEHTT